MIVAVADTHVAIWFLYANDRLSTQAKGFVLHAALTGRQIGIAAISIAEIVYLVEKARLLPTVFDDLRAALDDPLHAFKEVPVTAAIADAMRTIPRAQVPDMPDRIIAATAVHLGVPLISRDGRIRASAVETIW